MARITVEDCAIVIPNRFELCLVAGARAKNILGGAQKAVDSDEKATILALREIAEGLLDIESIKKSIVATESIKTSFEETSESAMEIAEHIKSEGRDAISEDSSDEGSSDY